MPPLLQLPSADTRNAILCTAIPSACAFVGSMVACKDRELLQFLKSQKFSSTYKPSKRTVLLANTAVAAPFGYASYLLYKNGGGFSSPDTSFALGVYGATLVCGWTLTPMLMSRNFTAVSLHTILLAGLSIVTTLTFYGIDKTAAYWTMPLTCWLLFWKLKAGCGSWKKNGSNSSGSQTHNSSSRLTVYMEGMDAGKENKAEGEEDKTLTLIGYGQKKDAASVENLKKEPSRSAYAGE